jgi:hypothetical protein
MCLFRIGQRRGSTAATCARTQQDSEVPALLPSPVFGEV